MAQRATARKALTVLLQRIVNVVPLKGEKNATNHRSADANFSPRQYPAGKSAARDHERPGTHDGLEGRRAAKCGRAGDHHKCGIRQQDESHPGRKQRMDLHGPWRSTNVCRQSGDGVGEGLAGERASAAEGGIYLYAEGGCWNE